MHGQEEEKFHSLLYVRNLHCHATYHDIADIFSDFGCTGYVEMVRDHHGEFGGKAYVKMDSHKSANDAIKTLHSKRVMEGMNKPLQIRHADRKRFGRNMNRMMMTHATRNDTSPGGSREVDYASGDAEPKHSPNHDDSVRGLDQTPSIRHIEGQSIDADLLDVQEKVKHGKMTSSLRKKHATTSPIDKTKSVHWSEPTKSTKVIYFSSESEPSTRVSSSHASLGSKVADIIDVDDMDGESLVHESRKTTIIFDSERKKVAYSFLCTKNELKQQYALIREPMDTLVTKAGPHPIYTEDLVRVCVYDRYVSANAIDAINELCCEHEPKLLYIDTGLAINIKELGFNHLQCKHKLCLSDSDKDGKKLSSMQGRIVILPLQGGSHPRQEGDANRWRMSASQPFGTHWSMVFRFSTGNGCARLVHYDTGDHENEDAFKELLAKNSGTDFFPEGSCHETILTPEQVEHECGIVAAMSSLVIYAVPTLPCLNFDTFLETAKKQGEKKGMTYSSVIRCHLASLILKQVSLELSPWRRVKDHHSPKL